MGLPTFLTLSARAGLEVLRRTQRRLRSTSVYSWRYSGSAAEGLTMAPQDLRPANDLLANSYYSGIYEFAGHTITTNGGAPFEVQPPSQEWFIALHSFRWLRHLRAANTNLIQAHSNALVADWIKSWGGRLTSLAWRSDVVAARQIAWLCHAPLLLRNTSDSTYQVFLKSLTRQARMLQINANTTRDGYPRLLVSIALAYSALCLKGREKSIKSATAALDREIERQILPDGGHISRNPSVLLDVLADIMPLRQAYIKQGQSPSPVLLSAIDRMISAVRFFRHSNGQLAQFNHTGVTPVALLSTILRFNEEQGLPQRSAPHSGYERLEADNTVVLVDVGKPHSLTTAGCSMAGTLSFELSSGNHRFVSNCGVPETMKDQYAPFTRVTAAHSTLVVDNASSSRFATDSIFHSLLPTQWLSGPKNITVGRGEKDVFQNLNASHDGYDEAYGLVHERSLLLSNDGNVLNGIDRVVEGSRKRQGEGKALPIAIRFHFPADIAASLLSSGHSILLAPSGLGKDDDAWTFSCVDGEIALEESMQFSGPGEPRKSRQIVIYCNSDDEEVRWTFMRRMGRSRKVQDRKGGKDKIETQDLWYESDPDESDANKEQAS